MTTEPKISIEKQRLLKLLDAIVFTIQPYYDEEPSLINWPWLQELAAAYNQIIDEVSETHFHSYDKFNI